MADYKNPQCPECREKGHMVTAECIDGDDEGLFFQCPICGYSGWITYDDLEA